MHFYLQEIQSIKPLSFFLRYSIFILILVPALSAASVFGPQITILQSDTLTSGQRTASVLITIDDTSGIVSYSLFYNGTDCTAKAKLTKETPDRRSLRLSYNAPMTNDQNTLIVKATNTANQQGTQYLIIKKENQPQLNWLRKALFHILRRLL